MTQKVRVEEICAFVTNIFERVDMPANDARFLAQELVNSELIGYTSHGLRKVGEYVDRVRRNITNARPEIRIDLDRGALARVDGDNGFGHLVINFATELAIERATKSGIAGVGVHNSNFAGSLGPFARKAAERGIATLMFANTGGALKVVSAPGGTEPRFSTNPIAAGVPRADGADFVLDFATSAVAYSRLSEVRDQGKEIPKDWTNASGDLVPFGHHKGFGLALLAEALAGALTSAGTPSDIVQVEEQGFFTIAINVDSLRDLEEFKVETDKFLSYIKNTPLAPGASPVRIPGEHAEKNRDHYAETGLTLQENLVKEFRELAWHLGLELPAFLEH